MRVNHAPKAVGRSPPDDQNVKDGLSRPGQVSGPCLGGRSGTTGEGSADRSRPRHVVKSGVGRQAEISDQEVLAGLVERVTFHNPESGFCVLQRKTREHRDMITVVGHAAMVAPGEWITASVYASRPALPRAMQNSLPAGGLRLCRVLAAVEKRVILASSRGFVRSGVGLGTRRLSSFPMATVVGL